jgi:MFS transporter, PAT family, beta-lactamase induction signal transducer AmpG
MVTLADHPRIRLAFLCLLYVGQGIPYGFVTVALAAHLAARGATAAAIGGVIAMAVLPWSFKWAWGPVVDSGRLARFGRRRPWLIVAQSMMIATAAGIAVVPETDISLLGWAILLHNVFVGLQDVAVDALAVDQLVGADRERASGMMFGSAYVGTFLGGAGLGIVTARFGLPTAIAALTAAQAVLLALVLVVREQPRSSGAVPRPALGLLTLARGLVRGMLSPQALRAAVAAFLLKLMPAALSVLMLVQLIERFGWSQERYAAVSGGVGVLLGLAASVAAGFLAGRVGPRRTAVVASLTLGAAWIAFGLASRWWDRTDVVFGLVVAETICLAATTVAFFAIFMRVAAPAVAATQFTASMAVMNLATSTGSWLAGPIGAAIDTPTAFLIAGGVQPLLALLVPAIDVSPGRRAASD